MIIIEQAMTKVLARAFERTLDEQKSNYYILYYQSFVEPCKR